MADISITDLVHLTANVQIREDSPLALADLTNLHFSSLPIIGDFGKPIDHFPLEEVDLGLGLASPSELIGNTATLGIRTGINGSFSILTPHDGTLFDPDELAPDVEIKTGECWAGLAIDANLSARLKATAGAIGVSIQVGTEIVLGTFVKFPAAGSGMPSFGEGLTAVLENYSIPHTPEQLRAIPFGIAHTAETTGTISLGASYSAPLEVNPLATVDLPLNLSLAVAPTLAAGVDASIALEGSFIVRTYRSADTKLVFGVYKKKKTTLSASISASAGVAIDANNTDILSGVLNAIVPPADLAGLHLDPLQKAELNVALKACVDQSISIAVNALCSASAADEAAVVYELDLSSGDNTRTDAAIASALKGDWSQFEFLPNARPIRSIVRELQRRKHKLTLNLLGLYNAISIGDYLKSTTVIHDEHGQIALIDKAAAKTLLAGTTPYAARADKLRSVLAQAFIATIAYGASAGKIGITSFAVRQSMLEYHAQGSCSDVTRQVLLARSVGLALDARWDAILKSSGPFNKNKFYIDAQYDASSVMRLFYQDTEKRVPYPAATLDRIGRETKIALLDPSATNAMQRRMALSSEEIWKAMNDIGNMGAFKFIPGIAKLDPTAIGAIAADWADVRWWSDALQALTPRLTAVLTALDQSKGTNPLTDPSFMSAHKYLENALSDLTSKTHSAFGDGWNLAVMYRLAKSAPGPAPTIEMDIGWNQQFEHYQSGEAIALGHSSGD